MDYVDYRSVLKMSGSRNRNFKLNGEILLRKQIFYLQGRRGNSIRFFSEEELKKGTNNFHYNQRIQTSCNSYKGFLDDHEVFLRPVKDFALVVVIMSSIHHRNVVKFLGCCLETQTPIIVYEFIPNCHTLSDYIFRQILPWSDRLRIATEVAEAVNYLHIHSSIAIIHRDIKSSIILLDEHCTAKITGFDGLFPMPTGKKIVNEQVFGTMGYLDPEYMITGDLNEKSDVYSYGVLLLELLTGNKPYGATEDERSLKALFVSCMEEGRVADILEARIVEEGRMEQIEAFIEVAVKCVRDKREERPTMKEVVQELWVIRKMLSPMKEAQL